MAGTIANYGFYLTKPIGERLHFHKVGTSMTVYSKERNRGIRWTIEAKGILPNDATNAEIVKAASELTNAEWRAIWDRCGWYESPEAPYPTDERPVHIDPQYTERIDDWVNHVAQIRIHRASRLQQEALDPSLSRHEFATLKEYTQAAQSSGRVIHYRVVPSHEIDVLNRITRRLHAPLAPQESGHNELIGLPQQQQYQPNPLLIHPRPAPSAMPHIQRPSDLHLQSRPLTQSRLPAQGVAGPSRHSQMLPIPIASGSNSRDLQVPSRAARQPVEVGPSNSYRSQREFRPLDSSPPRNRPTAGSSTVARPRSRSPPRHRRPNPPTVPLGSTPDSKATFRNWLAKFYARPDLQRDEEGNCKLVISRDNLLQCGYNGVMDKPPSVLKKLLVIVFHGEDGDDAGGLSKEFFHLLSKEMFDPMFGLFVPGLLPYTTTINPNSEMIDPEHHLQHFRLFGRIVAVSIFHKRLIDVHFDLAFYKGMLGQEITLTDLKEIDPVLYKSLTYVLENDITDVIDETFSIVEDRFGEIITVPLLPDGENLKVTNANKRRYVELMVQAKTMGRIRPQFKAFMNGFSEIIPISNLKMFKPSQLDSLIAGSSELDIKDWRTNTELENYNAHDRVIKWFWQWLEAASPSQRSLFLQFCTGSTRIPLSGFRDLRGGGEPRLFKITKVGTPQSLPQAHACFNRLDLPPYNTYEDLKTKINLALSESDGFLRE